MFVKRGVIKKGQLTTLYPGLVYKPYQPILLASIGNSYIFRCSDGTLIDGKATGLSGLFYKSIHGRDRFQGYKTICDISWLLHDYDYHVNPLSIGQIVNNANDANVAYEELTLHPDTCHGILKLLPNVNYDNSGGFQDLKIVPLIATRDIQQSEELFSTYFTLVQ